MTLNRSKGTVRERHHKSIGPKQGEWCKQCWIFVLLAEQEAIMTRTNASHVLLTKVCMNYYISFCYPSSWFITSKQLSFQRSTMLSVPPIFPPWKTERIPALPTESSAQDKNTLSEDLKGGLWLWWRRMSPNKKRRMNLLADAHSTLEELW